MNRQFCLIQKSETQLHKSLCWIPWSVKNLVKGLNSPPQSDSTALIEELNWFETIVLNSLKTSKASDLFLSKYSQVNLVLASTKEI